MNRCGRALPSGGRIFDMHLAHGRQKASRSRNIVLKRPLHETDMPAG
jgi:hypothetical protein